MKVGESVQCGVTRKLTPEEVNSLMTGGLLMAGTVMGRRRKKIKMQDGDVKFQIQVTVMGNGELHTIDRWSETPTPTGIPDIGEQALIPVRHRVFTTKRGATMARIEFGPSMEGESF